MLQHIWHSVLFSLEWRLIAFVITSAFFWFTSGEFVRATVLAIVLQLILFVVHVVWFYFRESAYTKKQST